MLSIWASRVQRHISPPLEPATVPQELLEIRRQANRIHKPVAAGEIPYSKDNATFAAAEVIPCLLDIALSPLAILREVIEQEGELTSLAYASA